MSLGDILPGLVLNILFLFTAAPLQPDEDDYGYTSQAASSEYDKLMSKYSAMPEPTPRFLKPMKTSVKNISDIKVSAD